MEDIFGGQQSILIADVLVDGGGTIGLNTDQARQAGNQTGGLQVMEGLEDAADDDAVADRHEDNIRRPEPVLLVNLQPDRLLSFDGQRVIRGVTVEAALAGSVFERQPECIIV